MTKSASFRYIGKLIKCTVAEAIRRPWIHLIIILLAIPLAIFMMPHDREWLEAIRFPTESRMNQFADFIGNLTQYQWTPLLLSIVLWMVGWKRSKVHWKKVALVCFVAGTAGGLLVNLLRPGLARPRPRIHIDQNVEDRFHFLKIDDNYHSFPSGHVMSNVSGATALAIVQPAIGVPYLVLSGACAWARVQERAHYPSDVTIGALFGAGVGIAFVRGMRVMRKEEDPLETEPQYPTSASGQN